MLRVNHLSGFGRIVPASGGGGPDPSPKTLTFCCGFECGQLTAHWADIGSVASFSTGTVRTGARSMRVNPSSADAFLRPLAGALTIATVSVIRFYVRFATLPNADTFIAWRGTGAGIIGVRFKQSDSKLYCGESNSSLNGASGIAVTTGVWYRIDLKADGTAGAKVVDAQVDGVALGQRTGTSASSPGTSWNIGSSATVSGDWFYDDVAISDTSADYPIGAGHVDHFVPVSDGAHSTGTAGNFIVGAAGANITDASTTSYQLIDEVPLDDATPDTDDYINLAANTGATANYVEHVIGPASGVSTPTLGPRGIEVIYAYAAASTGTGAHIFKINDNGTEDNVQSFNAAGSTSNRYARKHYTDPPSAASVWTTASGDGNFNNLRTRFGYSNDGNPDQYLTCVMVEAEFSD